VRINFDLEPTTNNTNPSQLDYQDNEDNNDQSFLDKFASLNIAPTKNNNATNKKVYTAISQIIAREICFQAGTGTNDVLPVASSNPGASVASSYSKGMSQFSRRILAKASSAVTSFMTSYDLSEDSRLYKGGQDDDDDDDDAIAFHDATVVLDEDDAGAYESIGGTPSLSRGDDVLLEQDIIWSVDVFIRCFKIITKHAEEVIRKKQDEGDEDGLTEGSDSLNRQTVSGIILDRYGDKTSSFLSLCREAGKALKHGSETRSKDEALAVILQNLKHGPGLEIILACLLQTNKAKLSPTHDVIVIFPMASVNESVVEACKIELNDVDISIFKISSAIKALEKRTEVLEMRANEAQRKALSAKQMGNTKLALMHMKRRQMCLKEIDSCSGSILNLDGGLNSIQRAKSDAEVLKTYELMNSSMKSIRQESDLEKVDDIMIELQENKEEWDAFNKSLHGSVDHAFSNDELEEELAQLMDNDDDEVISYESTNDSDITYAHTELKEGEENIAGEEEEELELESQTPMAV